MTTYEKDGSSYPRVSHILDVVDWGIRKCPPYILKKLGRKGTSFHNNIHKKVIGEPTRVPVEAKDKVDEMMEYLKQYKILFTEQHVYWDDPVNPERKYAGTLDLLLEDKQGRIILADIKTGKIYKRGIVQASAYKEAAEQFLKVKIDSRLIIKPCKDYIGNTSIQEYGEGGMDSHEKCWRMFNNMLSLYQDMHR